MFEAFENFVRDHEAWSYLVILIWTYFEGETVLIIAGMLAAGRAIDVHLAMASAFAGTVLGDQTYFLIGRFKGEWFLKKFPKTLAKIDKVLRILEKWGDGLILIYRFLYGIRNVTSFAVGLSKYGYLRFTIFNAIGALIWALCFGYGGYFFGKTMLTFIENAQHVQLYILGGVALVGLTTWLFLSRRSRRIAEMEEVISPKHPVEERLMERKVEYEKKTKSRSLPRVEDGPGIPK